MEEKNPVPEKIPRLPKCFTTVTTLSKILAMALFIALPFLGFYCGMNYQKQVAPKIVAAPQVVTSKPSPVSATKPSVKPQPQFTLNTPFTWERTGDVGVVSEKIGEIIGIISDPSSCQAYFKEGSARGTVLEQWTEEANGKKWYANHIDVPCLGGGCNWNQYCTEGVGKIFVFYVANTVAKKDPASITQTLSSFSFSD